MQLLKCVMNLRGVWLVLGVAGCALDLGTATQPSPDPDGEMPPVAKLTCADPVETNATGEHRAGEACLSCHAPGGIAPKAFTIGGTLYSGVTSATPVTGATIRLMDANGAAVDLITAQNGNFWTLDEIAFPITTMATSCPDSAAMVGLVQQTGGDCNSGGCHGATFRVHLP